MIRRLVMLGTVTYIFFASAGQAQIHGVLRAHPVNGRYFTDDNGKAILLTGSHTWSNLQDNGNGNPPSHFNFDAYLDSLEEWNHNFFRLWTWEESRWTGETTDSSYWFSPNQYIRTGPGTALDGLLKWDLTKFNQAYFDTLRQRVIRARARGIYVSIMLFNGWSVQTEYVHQEKNGLDPYKGHPYNVNNNIQYLNGDGYPTGDGRTIHTKYNDTVTGYQLAYVKKVIDEVNDLDNVLYEICNEAYTVSTSWQYLMIDSIHAYESRKPKQHPVGMTAQWPEVYGITTNNEMVNSDADWISPNWNGYTENMPAADGSKVIILDTDHIWGVGGDREWAWMTFTRGLNPIYMDVYNGQSYGCGASDLDSNNSTSIPKMLNLRKNLGYIRSYAQRVNLDLMVPHGELVSSPNYCIANPSTSGGEYIIFLRAVTNTTVNLTGGPSTLSVEWLNTETGSVVSGGTVSGGVLQYFTSPFGVSNSVLYLYDTILLPVEMVSFTGQAISSNSIQLNWSTKTEVGNRGFQIERKREENDFFQAVPSGFIEGHGTSNIPHSYQFIDHEIKPGSYSYRLKQIDNDGRWQYSNTVRVGIYVSSILLDQNYPNPFNASTIISFVLPQQSNVSLIVYNALGQQVTTLHKGVLTEGKYSIRWDGRNNEGINVGSGIYFYKLDVDSRSIVRKLLMLQ